MKKALAAVVTGAFVLGATLQGQSVPRLVISHVSLIDVVAGRADPDMTVVMEGDHIVAVGKSATISTPRGAAVVDGGGAF